MDVARWLQELGLGQYGETFSAQQIDSEVLPTLTDSDPSVPGGRGVRAPYEAPEGRDSPTADRRPPRHAGAGS